MPIDTSSFTRRTFVALGVAALFLTLALLVISAVNILLIVFAGFLLALPLIWMTDQLHKRLPVPRGLILGALVMLLILALVGFFVAAVPALAHQVASMTESIPQVLDNLADMAHRYEWSEPIAQVLENPERLLAEQDLSLRQVLLRAQGVFSSTLAIITIPLIAFLIAIYVSAEPDLYLRGFVRLFPRTKQPRLVQVARQMGHTLRWLLLGQSIAMLIIGVSTTVFLWFIGIPLAGLLGFIAAVTNFIPTIGPFLAGVPTVLVALTVGPFQAVAVAVFFVVLQNIEGSLITPTIQRRIVLLPPVLVIGAQFLLASVVGVIGMLLAMPLVACAMVAVRMLYVEDVIEAQPEDDR